jgi:hypothetical protein
MKLHRFFRIVGVLGVLIGWATMYFFDDWSSPMFWLLAVIATVLGLCGAWGGLSNQWGAPPFTNDPLGWRKAKQSYKEDLSPEGTDVPPDKP